MATARVERRLAAILAADVVGYSRLMERDEAGTFERLKRLRKELVEPVLERHGGRFVDLKGDGAIVEFQSAVAAVEAAVANQRAMLDQDPELPEDRRIRYRIGINLGEVIVDGGTIYGDGVNVAARIESLCEPGGVWLSRSVYNQVRGKLDLAFAPSGLHQVKNISEAVETFRVALGEAAPPRRPPAAATSRARPRSRRLLPLAAVAAALALVVAVGTWSLWPTRADAGRPGIAVLPFDNYGGDEATGRLADGITEDIITDLARFRDLDVIARNSTAAYKGRPADVRQVGRDLGVRYVLEGSIQRQADRVRVTAQLIDAGSGAHVWFERWDRPARDVFAVQTEVSERVASALGGDNLLLSQGRAAAKRKRPADLQAYDLVALADEALLGDTEADLDRALQLTDQAIARDPGMARAYVKKAWGLNSLKKFRKNYKETFAAMEGLARTAIAADPYEAEAYAVLAFATDSLARPAEALAAARQAVGLNPSSADILDRLAETMVDLGYPEDGAAQCDRAFRLNPSPPDWYGAFCHAAYFHTGRSQD